MREPSVACNVWFFVSVLGLVWSLGYPFQECGEYVCEGFTNGKIEKSGKNLIPPTPPAGDRVTGRLGGAG